jgi:hypothetical protein
MPTGINIDNATKGLGLTASTQNPTQSAYYKNAATTADQNLQKQGSVAAMTANQNMAQSGVKQGSAQANTMQAQQNAQTASNIATTNTGIAQTAEAQMQSDLSNKMSLAMQAGNYGAVNQALVDQGQQPIDFTKVETQQQEGNLAQASTALNNIISSLDPTDVATKTALTQQKATIDLQIAQALTGTKFDPTITAAASSKAFTSEANKLTNAFVGQAVAGAVNLLTTTTDGMNSVVLMQSNPVGSALLTKAESGDPAAMKEFGTLTVAINAWNTTKQIGGAPMPYALIQDLVNHGAIAMTQADLDQIQAEYDTPMKGSYADALARDAEILKTTGVPRKPSK